MIYYHFKIIFETHLKLLLFSKFNKKIFYKLFMSSHIQFLDLYNN